MSYNKLITIFVLSVLLCNSTLLAQKKYLVPSGNPNQLFYLQRNENTNTVIYELNKENGKLNTQNPIHVFWIMYATNQQRENLSEIEKEFAYGVKLKSFMKNKYEFTLVAYPKITLKSAVGQDKKYHIYVTPFKQAMILSSVFIQAKKSFFKIEPDVEYIQFIGTDIISGKKVTEKITP